MNKYIALAAAALFAAVTLASASPDQDMIIAKEKASWEAWKNKNEAEFRKLVGPHFMEIGPSRIAKLDASIVRMKKDDLKSYSLGDLTCTFPDPETAVLTYKAKAEGVADGKPFSGEYTCASVWRKMSGGWAAVLYAEAAPEKE